MASGRPLSLWGTMGGAGGGTVLPTEIGELVPDVPAEGTLEDEDGDRWRFTGEAGQSVSLEMWFHPGSGSGLDAETIIEVMSPDGSPLASEQGSPFLPPYVVVVSLPSTGLYQVNVLPVIGTPGRYSLALSFQVPGGRMPESASPPVGAAPILGPEDRADGDAPGLFAWPTPRRTISGWTFHDPRKPSHIGLDISARMWDPIVAVADGIVVYADWGGGYGNLVIVEHEDSWRSYYGHFTEIVVETGQAIKQGELLGGAGTTGNSTGPHLHLELRYKGRPVDPQLYLS
jgi:hypothetical protein